MTYRSGIDCPHCAGSGRLVRHETQCSKRRGAGGPSCTCDYRARAYACQFCGGTGRKPSVADQLERLDHNLEDLE